MKRAPAAAPLAPAIVSESDGVRYLHLDTPWVQGAMRIARPREIELEYVRRMLACLLLVPEAGLSAGHAVQLGLGAAALTRFCHSELKMRTTAVELNPSVIDACRLWFRLPHDAPRLEVLQMDAADFVADPARAGSVDLLCVDLYDHEAASPVLDSAAFYRDCHALLADGGAMAVNLFGRDAGFEASADRIGRAFGRAAVRRLRATKEGNTIVIASRSDSLPDRALLAARAENIETRFGLPATKWLRMLQPLPDHAPPAPDLRA